MVERLKAVIEQARQSRATADSGNRPSPPRATPDNVPSLPVVTLSPETMARHRLVDGLRDTHGARRAFDLLRTRLVQAQADRGLRRIGITSAGKGSGKSTICLNLALSMARKATLRCALLDFDMRRPSISRLIGASGDRNMVGFLTGGHEATDTFVRMGENLIIGLNDHPSAASAELMQDPNAIATLTAFEERFSLDIILFDLPPITMCDDVIALMPHLDGLIVVVEADTTKAKDIEECERMIGSSDKFIGVVLNKCRTEERVEYYTEI